MSTPRPPPTPPVPRNAAWATLLTIAAVDLALPWATCGGIWPTDAWLGLVGTLAPGALGIAYARRPDVAVGLVAAAWLAIAGWIAADGPVGALVGGGSGIALAIASGRLASPWPVRSGLFVAAGFVGGPMGASVAAVAAVLSVRVEAIGGGLALLGLVVLAEQGRAPTPSPAWSAAGPVPEGPDVLLIVVDTLRADAAADMDVVRRLSAEGADWSPAHASAPWTVPSMASLLTGQPVDVHRAGRVPGGASAIADDVPTLAERLSDAGYDTIAVTTNPSCRSDLGFASGFDWFDHDGAASLRGCALAWNGGARPLVAQVALRLGLRSADDRHGAERQVDRLLAVLRARRERPVFAWLHLLDPHLPYVHGDGPAHDRPRAELLDADPALREEVRRAYRAEVERVDRALMRLLDALPPAPRGRIVVFASDHGEELWEHGGFEHGHALWEELLAVPLVVTGAPSAPRGAGPAALLDVTPTILRAVGLPTDDLAGRPLQDPLPARPLVAQDLLYGDADAFALRIGATKVIVGDPPAVYDLASDPAERSPGPIDPLLEVLVDGLAPRGGAEGEAAPASAVQRRQLRALGYLD